MVRSVVLVLIAGVAATGCGGGSSSTAVVTHDTQSKSAPPGVDGTTASGLPTAPAEPYQLDPANHRFPAGPPAGRLDGKPFTPNRVEFTEKSLVFRQGNEFDPDLELKVALRPDPGKPILPVTLTVKPDQKWADANLPAVTTLAKSGTGTPRNVLVPEGYALTLEAGPREQGKVRGRIYLCLPDPAKSYLAGTFEAEWVRDFNSPPDAEDAPFVQGKVTHAGAKGAMLTVGYAGLTAAGEVVSDSAGLPVGTEGAVQSNFYKPRLATVSADAAGTKYDFTKLPPGLYVVYARLKDGPLTWQKAEVKADGKHTLDVALDVANAGTVEVKVPADLKGGLRLAPHEFGVPDPNDLLSTNLGLALDLLAEPKDGKATFRNVPPGKYAIMTATGAITRLGAVEVAAGKTATVELQPPKK
jgi:hypothetical protein